MKKALFGAVLIVAIFVSCKPVVSNKAANKPLDSRIAFVDSVETLTAAYVLGDGHLNLAVSLDYYKNGASEINRDNIRKLVNLTRQDNDHRLVIFLYGNEFDKKLATWLLGREASGCEPMVFVGIMPNKADFNSCGASGKKLTGDYFRKWIQEVWTDYINHDSHWPPPYLF